MFVVMYNNVVTSKHKTRRTADAAAHKLVHKQDCGHKQVSIAKVVDYVEVYDLYTETSWRRNTWTKDM